MNTGTVLIGREQKGAQHFDVDVVIVGSGASGAVVASVLSAAGQRVLVLEEGPYIHPSVHAAMRPSVSMRHTWRDGGMTAAVGLGKSPVINVTMGRAVGGSSMLTGGVCFRLPGFVHKIWTEERGLPQLTEAHMEPFFEMVEKRIHVEEVPESMRSRATILWGEGAEKMGGGLTPNHRNTKDCRGCSQCNFGCPHGAKLSVDMTFLPDAVRQGTVILSDCIVEEVTKTGGKASGIRGRLLNAPGGKKGDTVTVRARRVVLAASAPYSPLILWKSGISKRSKELGKNMTLHPSFRVIANFDEPVDGWKGAMQSAHSTSWEHEGITLMSVYTPPAVVISGVPGFGPEFTRRAKELRHLAMFGGMIHDEGGGRIVRLPGREPAMLYSMTKQDRAYASNLMRRLGGAYFEAGARELYLPVLGAKPVTADEFRSMDFDKIPANRFECSSQHPLGTTRMGSEARTSVVNAEGRVWDLEELYIVDGGVLPSSLGVNPQLTIMAMAMRLAHLMLDRPLPAV